MTTQEINALIASGKLIKSHTSLSRGYVSRTGGGYFCEYRGRFGKGFTLRSPNWNSTRYSYVTYYLAV